MGRSGEVGLEELMKKKAEATARYENLTAIERDEKIENKIDQWGR